VLNSDTNHVKNKYPFLAYFFLFILYQNSIKAFVKSYNHSGHVPSSHRTTPEFSAWQALEYVILSQPQTGV